MTVAADLAGLVSYAAMRLADRLEGLSDDEYLWEPVDGCVSVRLDADGSWRPDRPPSDGDGFSTIAWRLWHLGASTDPPWPPVGFESGAALAEAWFDDGPEEWPLSGSGAGGVLAIGTAAEATSSVLALWQRFATDVGALRDDELLAPVGPSAGQWADSSVASLVLHIADELIHHAAEVGVVRDLYAARPPR